MDADSLAPQLIFTDHFEKEDTTQIIYKDNRGNIYINNITNVCRKKNILNKFSALDAFLLGYLLASYEMRNF